MKKVIHILFGIMALNLLINALRAQGGDYPVFWNTANHWTRHEPLYALARDGVECFKYPPWVGAFLSPLALLSEKTAGILWRLVNFSAWGSIILWASRQSRSFFLAEAVSLLFLGFWTSNLVSGQITPVLLATALWGFELLESAPPARRALGWSLLITALSAKIFHLLALVGLSKSHWKWKPIVLAAVPLTALSIPAFLAYSDPVQLIRSYLENVTSGSDNLGGGLYGLPTLWVQLAGFPLLDTAPRLIAWVSSAILVGVILVWGKRVLSKRVEIFALALALSAAIHPLTFSVAFIWIYPLAVFACQAVFQRKPTSETRPALIGIFAGLFALIVLQSQLSGALGLEFLNFPSLKAVGVFILGISFVWLRKTVVAT